MPVEFAILDAMRFTQDFASSVNVVRGYGGGEIRINDQVYKNAVIVSASELLPDPTIASVDNLTDAHIARLLALQPELVLIGTGDRQVFPDPKLGSQFLKRGIGFEVMDTGAACRTFNVLVAEQRRVVALLLL